MIRRAVRDNVDGGNAALIDLVEMGGGKYVCIWNLGGWVYKLSVYDDATQSQEDVGETYASLEEATKAAKAIAAGEPIGDSARISDERIDYAPVWSGSCISQKEFNYMQREYKKAEQREDTVGFRRAWQKYRQNVTDKITSTKQFDGNSQIRDYILLHNPGELEIMIKGDSNGGNDITIQEAWDAIKAGEYSLDVCGFYDSVYRDFMIPEAIEDVLGVSEEEYVEVVNRKVSDSADNIQIGDKVTTDHDDRVQEVVDKRGRYGHSEYLLSDTTGWWSAWQLTKVSDSKKIKDSGKARIYKSIWGDSWIVEENVGGRFMYNHFDSYNEAVEYAKKMGFDTQIEDKGLTPDSQKIKDDDGGVLDGKLMIAFKEGAADDMISKLKEHENESGEIDGAQYEIYGVESQDGVAAVDMTSTTSEPNDFVKTLLKNWGIESVDGAEFKASEEMKELQQNQEEVSDSKKVEDDDDAFDEYFDYSKESIEQGKKVNDKCGGKRKVKDSDGIEELNEDWEEEDTGYEYEESDSEEFDKGDAGHYVATDKVEDSVEITDGYDKDAESVNKVNNIDILRDNKKGGVYIWNNARRKYFSTSKDAAEYIVKNFNSDGSPKKK